MSSFTIPPLKEPPTTGPTTSSTDEKTVKSDSLSTPIASLAAPTKRQSTWEKAARLLISGRLRVLKVDGDLVIAECKGDSGEIYSLGFDPRKRQWRCKCPARTDCSHLRALQSVVAVKRR